MFLLEPQETPYDLRFRLFGVAVRVHPMFWLISAVLGWGGGPGEAGSMFIATILVWVACVFVSVLIHELGHVFVGRAFGSDGHIVLYSFGGLAVGSNALARGWQRGLVAFAGPLAQFLLLGAVLAVLWGAVIPPQLRPAPAFSLGFLQDLFGGLRDSEHHVLVKRMIFDLVLINLFWPVLNLLPIWPLDGGLISKELCAGALGERGIRVSLGLSILVAGLLAVNAIVALPQVKGEALIPVIGPLFAGGLFMVLFFGMLAVQSWQTLQAVEAQRRQWDDHWDE